MVHKRITIKLLIVILSCLVGNSAKLQARQQGQAGNDIRFRLAQSYERTGDYDSALKLYQELYQKDSGNVALTDALRRTFLQLKRYDEAVDLLNRHIRRFPSDINMIAQLGAVYYLKSDEKKAMATWESAIAVDPKQPATYVPVVGAMTQYRLFDTAIATYQRARIACNDPTLFTSDIAYYYSLTLKYPEATKEYLNYVRQNPAQLGFVQARIGTYTGRPEGLAAATKIVEEAARADQDNLPFQRLLGWMYMEGKKFDGAYDVYRRIDTKVKAGGHEVYNFAQRALHERAYTVASRAFQDLETQYPSFDRLPEVKYGYAQSLEASDDQSDTLKLFGNANPFPPKERSESDPRMLYTGAIAAYERIITEFPQTEIAARSLLRVGVIKQEKFFDLDGASSTFESLTKTYPMFIPIYQEGTLRLGDVYLMMGSLEKAEAQYQAVAGRGLMTNPLQEQAALHLAEILYFDGHFQEAIKKLKELTGNAQSDATNDALALQIFIQENMKETDPALKQFSQADLLRRQRKIPEALAAFKSILESNPKSDIADEALISVGDMQTLMAQYADAAATYERFLKDFPESISLDRSLMKLANVYERGLKDPAKAISTYEMLLEKYPGSIYIGEARKRIRGLRGDNI